MDNIYQVHKLECRVTLFLLDGLVRDGVLFLSPCSANHSGTQTLLELFEEPITFLPFRKGDGTFSLVNKELVSHVRYTPGDGDEEPIGHPLPVRMVFLGGEVLEGTVTMVAPEGKRRLQDFLNSQHNYFLVDCGMAHYLVNPAGVCELAPL